MKLSKIIFHVLAVMGALWLSARISFLITIVIIIAIIVVVIAAIGKVSQ